MGGELRLNWDVLVPHVLHPLKVEIIEAMCWIGRSLSATELTSVLDKPNKISQLSYHLKALARLGVIEMTGWEPVRGTKENFYFLTEQMLGK